MKIIGLITYIWQNDKDKKEVFFKLYQWGFTRRDSIDVKDAWVNLEHGDRLDRFRIFSRNIVFTNDEETPNLYITNSPNHFIRLIKKNLK